jgi:hypothetical protein
VKDRSLVAVVAEPIKRKLVRALARLLHELERQRDAERSQRGEP